MSSDNLHQSKQSVTALTIAALGTISGDIGTSSIYALRQAVEALGVFSTQDIIGLLSLIVWSLIAIVGIFCIKLRLSANYNGEGGGVALLRIVQHAEEEKRIPKMKWLVFLLLCSVGLFIADAFITPAISVLSALEGIFVLPVQQTAFLAGYDNPTSFTVWGTIIILTGLASVQFLGTSTIGKWFGKIMILWFLVIGGIGVIHILDAPIVLWAFNPINGLMFLFSHPVSVLIPVLGGVTLAVTGAEAFHADMGHFNSKSLFIAWWGVIFPGVVLSYLGQGAYLIKSGGVHPGFNPFFELVPEWGIIPLVFIATVATIIASQAVISGAFSVATQMIKWGMLPKMEIIYTSKEHQGQVYVPFVNWMILAGAVLLVLFFRHSEELASMYGISVMLATTFTGIAIYVYHSAIKHTPYPLWKQILVFLPLMTWTLALTGASFAKIFHGGYITILVGIGIYHIVHIWQWGMAKIVNIPTASIQNILQPENYHALIKNPVAMVFTSEIPLSIQQKVPASFMHFLKDMGVIPSQTIFLHSIPRLKPFLEDKDTVVSVQAWVSEENEPVYQQNITLQKIGDINNQKKPPLPQNSIILITVYRGFMEKPDIGKVYRYLGVTPITVVEKPLFTFSETTGWIQYYFSILFLRLKKEEFSAMAFLGLKKYRVMEQTVEVVIQ